VNIPASRVSSGVEPEPPDAARKGEPAMKNLTQTLTFLRKLTFLQWTSIILTLLAGIFGISLVFLSGPPSPWAFAGFALSVSTAILTDRINRHVFENATTITLEREMNSPFDLKYLGTSSSGTDWLKQNCVGPNLAYNTVFNREDDGDLIPEQLEEYCTAIRKSLSGGCNWTDFFVAGSERIIDTFFQTLDKDQKVRYSAKRIQSSVPLLQFLIMRYADHKTCILFGWGFKGCTESAVFESEHSKTAAYFLNYARQMLEKAEPYIERGELKASAAPVNPLVP
jgi:hypothetical protein